MDNLRQHTSHVPFHRALQISPRASRIHRKHLGLANFDSEARPWDDYTNHSLLGSRAAGDVAATANDREESNMGVVIMIAGLSHQVALLILPVVRFADHGLHMASGILLYCALRFNK
jgi:hypothetical protein